MPDVVHVQVSYDPDVDVWLPDDRVDPLRDRLAVHQPRRRLPRVDKDAVPAREDDQLRVRLSDVEDVDVEPCRRTRPVEQRRHYCKEHCRKVP